MAPLLPSLLLLLSSISPLLPLTTALPSTRTTTTTTSASSWAKGATSGSIGDLHWKVTYGTDIDETSDFGLNTSSALTLDARSQTPDQCWPFTLGLGITEADFKANLQQLYNSFNSATGMSHNYPPLSNFYWFTGTNKALLIVRNQDSCYSADIQYTTHAYYIRQIQDFCEHETGWIKRSGQRDIVFIVEPNGVAPPAYSPRCNYY